MYTLIEDFEDDARTTSGDAFAAGASDTTDSDDENSSGDLATAEMNAAESESEIPREEIAGELDAESWSDDPVRMYLTQMGEIPLLTRKQEIELAKRIENTRQRFRA